MDSTGWKFLPSSRIFHPVEAGIFESRIAITKFSNKNIKLDIGGSTDIVQFCNNKDLFSGGAEFFTFSYLKSEDNFKFPVDAIDYYFGIFLSHKKNINSSFGLSSRLRIAHISSHLEDGHKYDVPFPAAVVYSREFVQFDEMLTYNSHNIVIRNALGLKYLFHTIPDEFGKVAFTYGMDARYSFSKIFSIYFSDELRIESVSGETSGNNNIETGVNIGGLNRTGISVFYTYYDGMDYKGQYYGKYFNSKGIGFKVNF